MTARRVLPALLLLFVGSGCAALIYEIVWFQLLQLVIGSSAVSMGVLLGTFMGGMCLGSLFLARVISPREHPLRVYAYLELGIGACGLLLLFGMPLLGGLYFHWGGSGVTGILLRGIAASICLLPPTLAMGATLPAMSSWVESTPEGVSWLGFFYGGNIGGGVIGCLLAGFYLLRVHDTAFATFVAVGLNVLVAALALLIAKTTPHEAVAAPAPLEHAAGEWAVYVSIGLSGFTALGAEVIWTRVLSLLFGATVYTFSLILAVFLLGLGIGSSIGSTIAGRIAQAPARAWLVPDAALRGHGLDGLHADAVAPVLADQPVDFVRPLVQLSARFRAVSLGCPAWRHSVGREFSARARIGGDRREGSRPDWSVVSMRRTRSARSSDPSRRACFSSSGSEASAHSRCW